MVDKLQLSFKDVRQLFMKIDCIPDRASWKSETLTFPDRPDEEHVVRYRDIIQAIKALLGNPSHAKHIVYKPRRVFSDQSKTKRIYNEMWTGRWWNAVQVSNSCRLMLRRLIHILRVEQSLLPEGAAVAPVILATDKTQLTQFSGNKSAYPVYLTLGNIPRAIRRRPSEHACILLGYLPVSKINKKGLTKREHKSRTQQLFHRSMRLILEPLIRAGTEGVEVTGGDGSVRMVFPILASYVADYPEQCLITCSKYGTCPKCQCPSDKLEDEKTRPPRTPQLTMSIIQDAWSTHQSSTSAEAACMTEDVNGAVKEPFWAGLPFADIHMSITPDVLHQLYQGVFKHIVSWCEDLLSPEELDSRFRCLPPGSGIRHFKNGISVLSQISGKERKDMAKVLLACLVGKVSKSTLLVFRSLLDFIYLAQYPTHDDDTLQYMADALKTFHSHKNVLIRLGIREDLNIPKIHSLQHYIQAIRDFGTTDNYNTEMFERLHIDFAKDAWRATNHRNEFPQMVKWITRNEKMALYAMFQKERQAEEELQEVAEGDGVSLEGSEDGVSGVEGTSEGVEGGLEDPADDSREDTTTLNPRASAARSSQALEEVVDAGSNSVKIAKYPPLPQQHLARIQERHKAPGFTTALAQFINDLQPPNRRLNRHDLSRTWLPFNRVDVFHKFKFQHYQLSDELQEWDVVKAIPGRSGGKDRFDNVVVINSNEAESTGMQGKLDFPHP